MKIIIPDYYPLFSCIAGKCPDTCCAGWEVVVDPESEKRYMELQSPLGERIRREMTSIDGETCFQAQADGRCPFLNEKNLCDIQAELGEEALCQTCHLYPRFINNFDGSEERGLSLSCPEAARIILSRRKRLTLTFEDHPELPIQLTDMDADVFSGMQTLRAAALDLAGMNEVPMNHRLTLILRMARKGGDSLDALPETLVEKLTPKELIPQLKRARVRCEKTAPLTPQTVKEALLSLDILTDGWKERLEKAEELSFAPLHPQFEENVLNTFLYRYLARSAYPDAGKKDFSGYAKFAVFSILALRMLGAGMDKKTLTRLTILYSREVEHDEENIAALLHLFKKDKRFSEKAFTAALLN